MVYVCVCICLNIAKTMYGCRNKSHGNTYSCVEDINEEVNEQEIRG